MQSAGHGGAGGSMAPIKFGMTMAEARHANVDSIRTIVSFVPGCHDCVGSCTSPQRLTRPRSLNQRIRGSER